MKDIYSRLLFLIMLVLIVIGIRMAWTHNEKGFILLIMGALMSLCFKELEPSPRQIGVRTILGKKIPVIVEGLIMVLPKQILSVVVMDARKRNHDFKDRISARCVDGATVSGIVSITFVVDREDDPPGTTDAMTGGQKLVAFDDNERMDGIIEQVDDMVVAHIKEIANINGHDYKWMISNPEEIGRSLDTRLKGNGHGTMQPLGNIRKMGVKIANIQVEINASGPVQKADEDKVLELLEREAELRDATTIDQQVDIFMTSFVRDNAERVARGEQPIPTPSRKEVWDLVDKARLNKAGQRQVIEAGNLVTFTQAKK